MSALASQSEAGPDRLEIVRSADRLEAVGPAWMELWRQIDGLIFQSHDWVSAWWRAAADRDRRALRIGLVWQGDRLLAVVPLAIARRKGLRFLEWAAGSYSDYGDILMAPECSSEALTRLWKELARLGGFDLAFLYRLLPDTPAKTLFAPGVSDGIRLGLHPRSEISHRISGPWKDGAAWFNSLSKKTRKNYRHGRNTIEKSGDLRFRLVPSDEPLAPLLKRLSVLKGKWLAERGHQSALFDDDAETLTALVSVLLRAGVLHIFVLESNETVIAISINFVQRGVMMAWVTTFDPDFAASSPGLILMMEYIKWSFDHGLGTVDFLCGGEAFKERFATQSVVLESVMGTRSLRGSLALIVDRVRRSIQARRSANPAPLANHETDAD
jgi:CelD/BcsL family acetyltransferase involved in cellulose biosynthesis